jgi:hypothetical protein
MTNVFFLDNFEPEIEIDEHDGNESSQVFFGGKLEPS